MSYLSARYDIITLLEVAHEEITEIFEEMSDNSKKEAARTPLAYAELKENLSSYLHAADAVIYAKMRKIEEFEIDAQRAEQEHALMDELIRKLDKVDASNAELWPGMLKSLEEVVKRHFENERENIFPKLTSRFSAELRETMGAEFANLQSELLRGGPVPPTRIPARPDLMIQ